MERGGPRGAEGREDGWPQALEMLYALSVFSFFMPFVTLELQSPSALCLCPLHPAAHT